jgi:hypothetical protein
MEILNMRLFLGSVVWLRTNTPLEVKGKKGGGAAEMWSLDHPLTLIRMVGGVYDSLNFEQKLLKTAWSKNIFHPWYIPNKMC